MEDLTLVAVVAVALFFDFTNGFHDTANATSVSTRALTPRTAVLLAAILNFAGAFVSFAVAATIATGIVNPEVITLDVILAGLVGAITWNLITWSGIWDKFVVPGLLSPTVGFPSALALMLVITWIIRKRSPSRVNRVFRRAQIVSG